MNSLLTTDPDRLDNVPLERLETEITNFAGHLAAATAVWLQWLAAYDRREGWKAWGCRSGAQWLSWKCGMSLRTGREHIRVARDLETLPLLRAAFLEGTVSFSKVRAITRVATEFNEPDLLKMAHAGTASQVERTVSAYRRAAAGKAETEAAAVAFADRRIQKRRNYDGSTTVSLTVPDAMANDAYDHLVRTADSMVEQHRADGQSNREVVEYLGGIAAVRADAAIALLTQTSDTDVGHNPDIHVLVDIDELAGPAQHGSTSAPDLDGGTQGVCQIRQTRLAAEIARRCACETNISAIVEDEVGNPLGVGRTTRIVPRRLRRALERRDHSICQFHGCGQTRRLHAHHVIHWVDGGETELDNLILLCSFHHHVVHEGGWSIRNSESALEHFQFITPTGSMATVEQLQSNPMHFARLTDKIVPEPNALVPLWAGERPNMSYITSTIIHNEQNRYRRSLEDSNEAARQRGIEVSM